MARQHGKYLPYQFLPEIDLEMHAASPSGTNARHITQEFEERIRTEGATPPVRSKKEATETVVVLGCAGSRNNESGGPRRGISRPHPLAMDLQSRKTEYGAGQHHAHAEIEARCLTPLLADVKNGGITPSPVLKIKYLRID